MPRKPAGYAAVMAQIAQLKAKAEALRQKEREPALKQVVALVAEYDFTLEEIKTALERKHSAPGRRGRVAGVGSLSGVVAKGTGAKGSGRKPGAAKGSKVAPKYRDPVSGGTWTGRGKPPVWLAQAIASGRSKEDFLIPAGAGSLAGTNSATGASAGYGSAVNSSASGSTVSGASTPTGQLGSTSTAPSSGG